MAVLPAPAFVARIPHFGALFALLILCCLFLFRLGDRDLVSSHEARAAQNAQTMLDSGRWDLPRLFDGRVEMQKPPLYYWLVALLGFLNGGQVDAWCVRLPAALAATGCVFLVFAFGVLRGRSLAGWLAAVMLATSLHFTALARTGRIDMPLTFTVALSIVAALQGLQQRRWQWFLLMYLAVAAGVMLKGPIAVVLLGVVLLPLFIFWYRAPFATLWWGVPLVLLLTLPWFLHANAETNGEWFRVFFWYHNVERGLGTEEKLRSYPWWFYGPQLLGDLLPWALLLPAALWSLRRADREARLGAIWLAAMLLVLSCMRFKRADYLLPAFPGAALLLGCTAERWYRTRPTRRLTLGFAAIVGVTAACWIGYLTWLVPALEQTRGYRAFAAEIRRHSHERVLFFRAEAHTLALHVGQPMKSLLEWENLDIWAGKAQVTYIVLPPEELKDWPRKLGNGGLEVVARSDDFATPLPSWLTSLADLGMDTHERSLVLVRTTGVPRPPANCYTKRQ